MTGRTLTLDGMTIEAVRVPPRFRLSGHEHGCPHVCVVVDGFLDESVNRGQRRCATGTTRVSPAGDRHTIQFGDQGAICLIILLDDRRLSFHDRSFVQDEWLLTIAAKTAGAMYDCHPTDQLTIESLGCEFLAQLNRRSAYADAGPPPPWLRRVRDRLQTSFPSSLSMSALASEENVSREHLARAFRLHYGTSPGELVRRLRLDAACRRLLADNEPLAAIAAECGFADQSHFTRSCVRDKGASPMAIRRARGANITSVQDFPRG